MGKRSGLTKSGRVMNPADRERKKQRAQELKKNKKQRTQVRHAIVKSRDPEELLEQLRRLDDQDLDPNCELPKLVISDKRVKCKAAYTQQLELYRLEKDENQITRLENLLHEYESERLRKEQQYQALMFSDDTNLGEIPLPSGFMAPNAALTPFMPPPPVPPTFSSAPKSVPKKIEEKTIRKTPPGPPPGVPPSFDDDDPRYSRAQRYLAPAPVSARAASQAQVEFDDYDIDDDDLGPVAMPDVLLPPKPTFQPVRAMISAPIIPPSMAPPPPPMPPGFQRAPLPPTQPFEQRRFNAGPSAVHQPPMMPPSHNQASRTSNYGNGPAAEAVISAAPQMRNFKKETTKFVPAALQVRRPDTQPRAKPISRRPIGHPATTSTVTTQSKPSTGKTADQTCDEFLREIADLL